MAAHDKIKEILKNYLQGNCTDDEKAIVQAWYRDQVDQPTWDLSSGEAKETGDRILAELRHRLQLTGESENAPVVRLRPRRNWTAYAAACVVLIAAGVWWIQRQPHHTPEAQTIARSINDIAPGGNKAILTLAGGRKIVLDSAANGLLARQGNTAIVQRANGAIEYQPPAKGLAQEVLYNSLSTPAGGQYQLVLPDGTKVWLNALTTIRYPSTFDGPEREVQIDGEAYLEVAKDEDRPFRVTARDMKIEVLGTAFNVNDYDDEPAIRTSLLQGAVRLTRGSTRLTLKQGEQAQTAGKTDLAIVPDADVLKAIAWKNGSFAFDNDPIQAVMRQLAKWYDIDIRYQGEPPHAIFGGSMRRTLSLQQVLSALSKYGVHFQLTGRTLVVMP